MSEVQKTQLTVLREAGLLPSELVNHDLWWNAPDWLRQPSTNWPAQPVLHSSELLAIEERDICLHTVTKSTTPVIPLKQFPSFTHLKRVTAWIHRFVDNCRCERQDRAISLYLSTSELIISESYWTSLAQQQAFAPEIEALKNDESLPKSSRLFSLRSFLDSSGLLRVGDRSLNVQMSFSLIHPVILPGKHPITSLLISSEHRRLMHAGPTLLAASLNRRYYITSCRNIVCSITRGCVTCR